MKRRIRLTESDLHRVIKECVYNILNEGKVVNNKPFFKREGGECDEYIKPGNGVRFYSLDVYWQRKGFEGVDDAYDAAKNPNDNRLTIEDFRKGQDEFNEMAEKHNKRSWENYYSTFYGTKAVTPRKPIWTRDADNERFEIYNKNKVHQRIKNNDKKHFAIDPHMDNPFRHIDYYDLYDEEK